MPKENQGKKNRTRIILIGVILIAASGFLISSCFALWLLSEGSSGFRANLKDLIREELIREDPEIYTNVVDAIYVLGGSQCSLAFKYKAAADLYHKGICKKIMILSRPGITEYSSLLRRNLTNDEWAIRELEKLGVPRDSVEPISITEGLFGTLTEAKSISRLMKERGYKGLVLISSPCHTHRVKISFEEYLKDYNAELYVKGSGERRLLRELVKEFIKLKIYEYLLV